MPLSYNHENRARILKEFMNEPYGWAGLLNNRDCSSFTQDYFSVFGKYLHRNSKAQTTNGTSHRHANTLMRFSRAICFLKRKNSMIQINSTTLL